MAEVLRKPRAIAIVGAAGKFPGAPDLDSLWNRILARESASREVPPERWPVPTEALLDPSGRPDRLISTKGCFLDPFEAKVEGIDRALVDSLDPLHRLALTVGVDAFHSGSGASLDRDRVSVVLANIVLPTDAASAFSRAAAFGDEPDASPLDRQPAALPAALLARALGLGGGSYTLDAACASSLYALHLACLDLEAGRADAVLAGGVSRPQALYTQVGFTQLQALSPSGRCAPFDTRADGLVVGEGACIFLLQRLEDAVASGRPILGVIRGIGLSNDVGGSLLSPEREGQVRAMGSAYASAGWRPSDVDLIECHGTGTPRGDAVELSSLDTLWSEEDSTAGCAIGSVKSNVGHLLTAAAATGLAKVLLALREGVLPPSAGFEAATAAPGLGRFRVPTAPEPWQRRAPDLPRRAAVSAFGFGGINAHLLVEEWLPGAASERSAADADPIAIVGMSTRFGRLRDLAAFREAIFRGERVLDPRPADRAGPADEPRSAGPGAWIDELEIPLGRYRIPPRELPSLLPQQLLALDAATAAADDAGLIRLGAAPRLRTGALVGQGLDPETTRFQLRWLLREREDERLDELGPALDSARTLGALGGVVAGRIARELQLGGPSFSVSGEDTSGLRALEVAARLLQAGDADAMIVAGVEVLGALDGSLRPWSRTGRSLPFERDADGCTPGEGAAAVVLKRLSDAEAAGDRIYAVLRGVGAAGGGDLGEGALGDGPTEHAYVRALERAHAEAGVDKERISLLEAHGSGIPDEDAAEARALHRYFGPGVDPSCALGSAKAVVGHTGAASGLASVVKTALALFHEILPPHPGFRMPVDAADWDAGPFHVPRTAQAWLRDRAEGPRLAGVSSVARDGTCLHAVLGGVERPASAHRRERARPAGDRGVGLFVCRGRTEAGLASAVASLREWLQREAPIEALAAGWHRATAASASGAESSAHARAFVGASRDEILRQLDRPARPGSLRAANGSPEVAFVFPGSGNHFVGMGRSLGVTFPETIRALDSETTQLRSQMMPRWFAPWRASWPKGAEGEAARAIAREPARMILGQVAHGIAMSDCLRFLGVEPDAVVGYSLGETAGLFSARAWRDRDGMFSRTMASPLFRDELSGRCDVARRAWGVDEADWHAAVVNRSADEVRAALRGTVSLLIVNAPGECVVGGRRGDVEALVAALACEALPLEGVPTVHCGVVEPVAAAYRRLHVQPTTAPPGVRFYSGAWAKAYEPTDERAADSILANALHGFDFPAVIEKAWEDGVRIFVELGPQGSCTRMIGRILAGREHLAVAACQRDRDPASTMLGAVARMIESGIHVDLERLYGAESGIELEDPEAAPRPSVSVPMGRPWPRVDAVQEEEIIRQPMPIPETIPANEDLRAIPAPVSPAVHGSSTVMELGALARGILETSRANVAAHGVFLHAAEGALHLRQLALENERRLLQLLGGAAPDFAAPPIAAPEIAAPVPVATGGQPPAFDRDLCMEFAIGKLSNVLGPAFAEVDLHATRVRLPDEPLMLVDRIVSVEGTLGILGSGRCVTEHDVHHGAWYLDGGRAPVCISVESGQADLFLCAYLGIDLVTKGERVYRLLDAQVIFHRDLPRPGETVRYDIRVHRFIRQGDTHLLFFEFDGTIAGEPLITMRSGCAGFFSPGQLASGKGIVGELPSAIPQRRLGSDGRTTAPFEPLVSIGRETLGDEALDALRRGDAETAFGPLFAGITLPPALRLPDGRMRLVDRIIELDPTGGRFGLGTVTGEADIEPDAWFLTCHFSDDPVMPGTLMYECCLHTLRVLLLRMGWVCDESEAPEGLGYAPVVGNPSKLRCRGQVTPTTKKARYRIDIKEIGYDPEPYVLADASMFVDDLHAVEMEGMSVRLVGMDAERIARTWARSTSAAHAASEPVEADDLGALFADDAILPLGRTSSNRPIYGRRHIEAFATGLPSQAFGAPYHRFDGGRMARLPSDPFSFIDEIVPEAGAPFRLEKGASAKAVYRVPTDAWYFGASRLGHMPYSVLLEAALQPCGWLAAWLGSALRRDEPLFFRNLEGTATVHDLVTPGTGDLETLAHLDLVSEAGGMILQQFTFETRSARGPVFTGTTRFGFFPEAALAQQAGIRVPTGGIDMPSGGRSFPIAATAPLTPGDPATPSTGLALPAGAFRFLDRVDALNLTGGPHGLGSALGSKSVDPDDWFFAAHFHGDPVMPGSLGVEALLQLMQHLCVERWPSLAKSHRFAVMPPSGESNRWVYRGQVRPATARMEVVAHVKSIADLPVPRLVADGYVLADGKAIYSMHDLSIALVEP
ncbi:beta-ketoacyl synthase N-terminal-like domain-containing protein [Vulgatibacter incomptus]|uniref:Omega-3 polyunsaturated fatty acid synthase n=1 Tax=Vulgatibacter incomptus TaxID=1391653 RepID=A0A0K1PF26_9BACT|nr:beta-ketoacyl synthase N-terminal-like domain-containing protein [Vulgatibacter incomptus]AKU92026.1 omega-3 polyunsaturated fatty acid synthase [Vulgatibacter incomptus]